MESRTSDLVKLFYSPFGDHGRTGLLVRGAHAVLPKRIVCAAAAKHTGLRVKELLDFGLNGNTPQEFRSAFDESGLVVLALCLQPRRQALITGIGERAYAVPSIREIYHG